MNKDEQIGFHKGSISVLVKEREELLKIVNITEQLIQMHSKALKDLGVDLETVEQKKPEASKKIPIENLL
ncbi:MAG: hypothetical protein ACMXYK_02460 [Candidatus Woesearchaeota archaeon]